MMEAYRFTDNDGDWIRLINERFEWIEPAKHWVYEPSSFYMGFHYRNIHTNKLATALD